MSYHLRIDHPLNLKDLRHDNVTYNINRLLMETSWVGLKLHMLDGLLVWDAAMLLDDIYLEWGERPHYFQQFQVKDWGNLLQCRQWIAGLVCELHQYPSDAVLKVSA